MSSDREREIERKREKQRGREGGGDGMKNTETDREEVSAFGGGGRKAPNESVSPLVSSCQAAGERERWRRGRGMEMDCLCGFYALTKGSVSIWSLPPSAGCVLW